MTVAVQMHLTLSELEDRYLHASTPVEMRRAHVILLRAEGVASSEVAHITRYSASYISKLVAQFNQDPDLTPTSATHVRTMARPGASS